MDPHSNMGRRVRGVAGSPIGRFILERLRDTRHRDRVPMSARGLGNRLSAGTHGLLARSSHSTCQRPVKPMPQELTVASTTGPAAGYQAGIKRSWAVSTARCNRRCETYGVVMDRALLHEQRCSLKTICYIYALEKEKEEAADRRDSGKAPAHSSSFRTSYNHWCHQLSGRCRHGHAR
jgi:hypothetical protein